ncbi:YitT family protein [Savagea sp. SN6]|uniref:YitT family protein n=1 Tax=Savagea serpentis TaxID=2785297 RepID=A0A8J7GK98_9BACL|nr:YitT family protein [Savagea serpentis]MBF4501530.1 YitT family protein [Savagea serpentis]
MFFMESKRIGTVIVGALLVAMGLNFFLINANVYSSGFAGVAQLISTVAQQFLGLNWGTGLLLLVLNIPVLILGWFKVGKGFTIYSIISVGFTTFFLEILPVISLTDDIILNAVAGGTLIGVGIGITMKLGASTGGMDIVVMLLARSKDRPVGMYFFTMNAVIVFCAGLLFEPANALYTMVGLYLTSKVIDAIHTSHEKLTVFIITENGEALQKAIHERMVRGITVMPAMGAYTKREKDMLYLVVTRYELYDLEQIIKEIDPFAFTNVVQTVNVFGFFRKEGESLQEMEARRYAQS